MTIFKYSLKKYYFSLSTWLFILMGIILVSGITLSFISQGHNNFLHINNVADNKSAVLSVYILLTPIIAAFSSIFLVYKVVQLFRDSQDDGTMLLIITKPISRKKILFYKWLSLAAVFMIYLIIILGIQTSLLLTFAKYPNYQNDIFKGLIGEVITLFICFLISSQILIMLSLKFGFRSLLGITFIATVGFSTISILQTTSYKPTYDLDTPTVELQNDDTTNNMPRFYHNLSTMWNSNNDQITKLPQLSFKTNTKHFALNKKWQFNTQYQMGRMSSMFLLKNYQINQNLKQGIKSLVKITSVKQANFDNYQNNLFLDADSHTTVNNIERYFNNSKYSNMSIDDYLKPALKDAQRYFDNVINNFKPNNNDYNTINISIVNFHNYNSGEFSNSANKFINIMNQPKVLAHLWNLEFGNEKVNKTNYNYNYPKDISYNYNANTLFNILLNYHMHKSGFVNLSKKKITKINFWNNMNFLNDDKQANLDNLFLRNNNQEKNMYIPWQSFTYFSDSLISNLIETNNPNGKSTIPDNITPHQLNKYFYQITYQDFANRYLLTGFYLILGITLLPVSYWWFKRSDFD